MQSHLVVASLHDKIVSKTLFPNEITVEAHIGSANRPSLPSVAFTTWRPI